MTETDHSTYDHHAGHDHAGHDHAGHDHAGHDHSGHGHGHGHEAPEWQGMRTSTVEGASLKIEDVEEAMKDVVDPELGINVVDLGLVYGVHVDDDNVATLDMTLTSAASPLTDEIEDQARSVWLASWRDGDAAQGRPDLRLHHSDGHAPALRRPGRGCSPTAGNGPGVGSALSLRQRPGRPGQAALVGSHGVLPAL